MQRTERKFKLGDWIYLRLQPYRKKSMVNQHNLNLSLRYFGPFCVMQKISEVVYLLDLPKVAKMHPIFSVSCLKRKLGTHIHHLPRLPLIPHNEKFCLSQEL